METRVFNNDFRGIYYRVQTKTHMCIHPKYTLDETTARSDPSL